MLELKDIKYSVPVDNGDKEILKGISLKIDDSGLVVITGPNGSGKSTLAKILMGIIKPTSGSIFYNGADITNYSISDRAKLGFAYAFQQPICFKGLKVKDLIDIASGKKNTLQEQCEYLSNVGLCARNYIDRELNSKLSGGELKRIEIAMMLCRKGKLNIYDEPEAGIDLWSFDSLVNIFKDSKDTNIIISHQQKIINIAKTIVLLRDGEIVDVGGKEKILPLMETQVCNKLKEEI